MQTLRVGSAGAFVRQWETFLCGQDLLADKEVDTKFTEESAEATRNFQIRHGLGIDGVAGNQTIGFAMAQLGFEVLPLSSEDYPPKPRSAKSLNFAKRQELFGKIEFEAAGTKSNPEAIKITNDWAKKNLTSVVIPQLKGVYGAPASGKIWVNAAIRDQTKALFQAWEDAGLIDRVLSWGGSYNPRFIRGSRTTLSNHAHGTAIDLNVPWNGLGCRPALVGEKGSVRELVDLAWEHGWFWGGWYSKRKDGMHLEACRIVV